MMTALPLLGFIATKWLNIDQMTVSDIVILLQTASLASSNVVMDLRLPPDGKFVLLLRESNNGRTNADLQSCYRIRWLTCRTL
jgi:hypothetical protein